MRPIIFCRIADMKYYHGVQGDKVYQNSAYVKQYKSGGEQYNFFPDVYPGGSTPRCFGFVMPNGPYGFDAQLHIEKMNGCELMKDADSIDDVTVVFCSKAKNSDSMRVVGFYKHATVYRRVQDIEFDCPDGGTYYQDYSFVADAEDCVLLPYKERHSSSKWIVPTSRKGGSTFGFGRSNFWFASGSSTPDKERAYVEKMIESIDTYEGDNWVWRAS